MKQALVVSFLVFALTACGGGGGGGTATPPGPVVANPSPSPIPSATASAAPSPSATPTPTQTPTTAPGAFANTNGLFDFAVGGPSDAALQNPNVDGVTIFLPWNLLEPTDGTFAFNSLDVALTRIHAAGKKAAIVDPAGVYTPAWLFSEGAQTFNSINENVYDANFCQPQMIPLPWDPVLATKHAQFVAALGAHVSANAIEAAMVVRIDIDGINTTTGELLLPAARGFTITSPISGKSCTIPNEDMLWLSLGYTRTRVENAWQQIAQTYANAFPTARISLAANPLMPPIDQNGQLIPNVQSDPQIDPDLIAFATGAFGQHFVAQNNVLGGAAGTTAYAPVASAASSIVTGYQMLWYVTGESSCRMNGGVAPCDPATELGNALNAGLAAGAKFLEVYDVDITNPALAGVVAQAHASLPH